MRAHGTSRVVARLFTLLAAFAVVASGAAWAQALYAPHEVLVRFRSETPAGVRDQAAALLGGEIVAEQPVLGYSKILLAGSFSVEEAVAAFERDPDVEWAEPNAYFYPTACPSCPQDPFLLDLPDAMPENQWGIFKAGIPTLWRHGGGGDESVVVAIVDTGIDDFSDPHPDLKDNVLASGFDFVETDADPTDEGTGAAQYGHGTHVAGIAAAVSNGAGITGVAFCSKILVVRVLDCTAGDECPGTSDAIANGIQWAADNGARVINLSLAGSSPSNAIRSAVHYAIGQRCIVVAASGNDSMAQVSYPARYPEVIAVGATDSDDNVASFSNYGPELDVVAPGVDVWSTVPGDLYDMESGTSQAAPFLSGIAALAAAKSPDMTQPEMEAYLRDHALPLAGENGTSDGEGRVDLMKSEDWSDAPPPYPAAGHESFSWEWLGADASHEESLADPGDADWRPNLGAPHHRDGYDDGVFPPSIPNLPFLPPHIAPGASMLDVEMGVCRWDGPRYDVTADKQLHLDVWADWDGDMAFEEGAASEHVVGDHAENPGTWGLDATTAALPIDPVDEHLLGNPLVVRSRLAYGASVGTPDGTAETGEVEDDDVINFVEEFDVSQRVHTAGVYTTMDGWDVGSDPNAWCENHGQWEFAKTDHPGGPGSIICNGAIERLNIMATPVMDWTEYTTAKLRFWYCHHIFDQCSATPDRCRVRIDRSGVKTDLGPIPLSVGTLTIDLSAFVGSDAVFIEFIEETDWIGTITIDDVAIWAYDGERPPAVADLAVSRPSDRTLELTWTAPSENEIIPSPPAEDLANVYDVRYAPSAIATDADWRKATPATWKELAGGSAVPAAPGSGESVAFDVPSAFQDYYVAVRTSDETVNASLLSNSPGDSTAPVLGVSVVSLNDTTAAPGDTTRLFFTVTNTGGSPDAYALGAGDTAGWDLLGVPDVMTLGAGASDSFIVDVVVPGGAANGEIDSVTVAAVSIADPSVTGVDFGRVEVEGGVSSTPAGPSAAALLRISGANPFAAKLRMELTLAQGEQARVLVYDAQGRMLREVLHRRLAPGRHSVTWDGLDDQGRESASGVYFVRAEAGSESGSRRVLRIQ